MQYCHACVSRYAQAPYVRRARTRAAHEPAQKTTQDEHTATSNRSRGRPNVHRARAGMRTKKFVAVQHSGEENEGEWYGTTASGTVAAGMSRGERARGAGCWCSVKCPRVIRFGVERWQFAGTSARQRHAQI